MKGDESLERAAAELTAALHATEESVGPMPEALRARIIKEGARMVREQSSRVAVDSEPAVRPRLVSADTTPVTGVAALRDSLLRAADVTLRAWSASTDPAAVSAQGDIVWSAATQRGVMRFTGLAPNDPRLAQYQLWIIDAERDARYPVDGGVFDVASDGEVLVRVTPRLPVGRATLFAVTLERPGGVVVSTRERLVLTAPVEG